VPGKGMAVFQHLVKYVLYHIFTRLALVRHMEQKSIQRAMVPLKKHSHSIQVSGFYPEHDRIIA
jgi:hypothetical protein